MLVVGALDAVTVGTEEGPREGTTLGKEVTCPRVGKPRFETFINAPLLQIMNKNTCRADGREKR